MAQDTENQEDTTPEEGYFDRKPLEDRWWLNRPDMEFMPNDKKPLYDKRRMEWKKRMFGINYGHIHYGGIRAGRTNMIIQAKEAEKAWKEHYEKVLFDEFNGDHAWDAFAYHLESLNKMERKLLKDKVNLELASVIAKLSVAERKKVGCVITREGRILSSGFNGMPPGEKNSPTKYPSGETVPQLIHAEKNAIAFAAKNGIALEGSTLYVTFEPCMDCATLIVQSGIKRVVYEEALDNPKYLSGSQLLRGQGIQVEQIKRNENPENHLG